MARIKDGVGRLLAPRWPPPQRPSAAPRGQCFGRGKPLQRRRIREPGLARPPTSCFRFTSVGRKEESNSSRSYSNEGAAARALGKGTVSRISRCVCTSDARSTRSPMRELCGLADRRRGPRGDGLAKTERHAGGARRVGEFPSGGGWGTRSRIISRQLRGACADAAKRKAENKNTANGGPHREKSVSFFVERRAARVFVRECLASLSSLLRFARRLRLGSFPANRLPFRFVFVCLLLFACQRGKAVGQRERPTRSGGQSGGVITARTS